MSVQALQIGYQMIPHSGGFPVRVRPQDIVFDNNNEPDAELSEAFAQNGILNVIYTKEGGVFRGTEFQAWAVYDTLNPDVPVSAAQFQRENSVAVDKVSFFMKDFHRAGGMMGAIKSLGVRMAFGQAANIDTPAPQAANIDAPVLKAA